MQGIKYTVLVGMVLIAGCARSVTSTPGDAPNLEEFVAEIKQQKPQDKREPLPLLLNQEVFSYAEHTTVSLNPNPQSALDRAQAQLPVPGSPATSGAGENTLPPPTTSAPTALVGVEQKVLRSPFDYPQIQTPNSGLRPDSNRPKQPLETYTLDSLAMVGTMGKPGSLVALIQSPDKVVYRVSPGQYMGQSDGKVVEITTGEIKLVELVADGAGGWIEQSATLVLKE